MSDLGIPFRVLVDEADVLLPPPVPEMRLVVKMHGDLRTSDTIVLTRDDYREYATRRPAMARLVSSLFLTRRPLFHGFGMTDANFRGLYDQIVSLLPPGSQPARAYAFARRADPQFTASWRARGVSVVDCEDWEEMDRCIRRLSRRVRGKRRARTDLTRLAETLGAPDVVEDLVDVHDRLAAAALAAVEEWEGVPPGTRGGQRERAAARTRLSAAIRALLHLDRAGLPSASSPELRARIGEALLDLRADGEAREALEAAWAASSGRLRARSRRALAVAYHRLGDPRSAWRLWAVESEIEGEGEAGREVALGDASRALDAARAVAESMLRWGRTRAARAFVLEALARFGPAVRTFEGEVWPEGPAARRTVGWGCVRVAQAHVLLARCCGGPQGDEARAAHGEAAERLLHRASVLLPAGERRVALGELAALGSGADGGRPRPEDLERLAAEGRVPS
ncbi:SIR2 family protein [Myxococcota bacterium]|nr:SIR2 family protein [Myxococcota bacterium]